MWSYFCHWNMHVILIIPQEGVYKGIIKFKIQILAWIVLNAARSNACLSCIGCCTLGAVLNRNASNRFVLFKIWIYLGMTRMIIYLIKWFTGELVSTAASWSSGRVQDSGLGSRSNPGFNTLPVRPLVVPPSKALQGTLHCFSRPRSLCILPGQ